MTKAEKAFFKIRTNIQDVIKNKMERAKATFFFSPEKQYYIYEGVEYSEAELNALLPVEVKRILPKGENPNARKCFY